MADGTYASYSSALKVYSAHCKCLNLPATSQKAMEAFILNCFHNGDSDGRAMVTYSALLFWAKMENITLSFSPQVLMALKAYKRLYKRQRQVKWVTLPDLQALLDLWQDVQLHYWVLLIMSFYTLVRPAEILHMKWGHMFLKEKYIYLPWSKNDPEGEGTYVTLLPLALEALTRLKNSLARPPSPVDTVFPLPPDSLNPWLASQCEKAGVGPYTWYHLKHGGATFLALKGWSFERIKAHGRWKSDVAARLYIHAPTKQ